MPIGFQRFGIAAPEFAVTDPAAGLHHAGCGKVVEVDQHPWRQAVEVAGAVGFVSQHARQLQGFHADIDAVADLQVERGQQPRFNPGFTGLRSATGYFLGERGGRALQFTT
ncbi:hypothetical protein D3C84_564480 [compost metagenome]